LFPQPVLNTAKRTIAGLFPHSTSLSVVKEGTKTKGGTHD